MIKVCDLDVPARDSAGGEWKVTLSRGQLREGRHGVILSLEGTEAAWYVDTLVHAVSGGIQPAINARRNLRVVNMAEVLFAAEISP